MNAEEQLRHHFDDLAQAAPTADGLAERVRRRSRRQRYSAAAAVAAACLVGMGILGLTSRTEPAAQSAATNPEPSLSDPSSTPLGTVPRGREGEPLKSSTTQACAIPSAPTFAFDGVVTRINDGGRPSFDDGDVANTLGLVNVTMRVNEWFVGGGPSEVVVVLPAPDGVGSAESRPMPYSTGTRLLVSGVSDPSKALDWSTGNRTTAIASIGCGVGTYFHSDLLSTRWREAAQGGEWSSLYSRQTS